MKVEIELTRQDYFEFNRFVFFKTQFWKSALTGIFGLVVVLFVINASKSHVTIESFLATSIIYIILYSFLLYRGLNKARSAPMSDGSILRNTVYEITEDSIISEDGESRTERSWSSIKYVEESKKAYYLFVDSNMAVIVPKRIFQNDVDKQTFVQYIKEKINSEN